MQVLVPLGLIQCQRQLLRVHDRRAQLTQQELTIMIHNKHETNHEFLKVFSNIRGNLDFLNIRQSLLIILSIDHKTKTGSKLRAF